MAWKKSALKRLRTFSCAFRIYADERSKAESLRLCPFRRAAIANGSKIPKLYARQHMARSYSSLPVFKARRDARAMNSLQVLRDIHKLFKWLGKSIRRLFPAPQLYLWICSKSQQKWLQTRERAPLGLARLKDALSWGALRLARCGNERDVGSPAVCGSLK
jgi:hypothetical protein